MSYFGDGWWIYYWGGTEDKDTQRMTWTLVKRVLRYARPYWLHIAVMLVMIAATSVLGLFTPLIFRDLIDNTLPNGDVGRLNILALGLILIPVLTSLIGMYSRRLN